MANNSNTKVLNVPTLRFKEFTGEWKKYKLGNVASISKGTGISKDQRSVDGIPCILYGELYTTYKSEIIIDIVSKTNIDPANLIRSKSNDVIIPSSGETAIDISTARCVPYDNVLLGGDLNIIRLEDSDGRFFCYQLNGVRKRDIAKVAQGVSVVHLYGENIKSIKVNIPSLQEQEKIASLLFLIDQRIATQNKIIEDLKKLKSAIVDKLYSSVTGETYSYRQLFEVINDRNKSLEFTNILSASQELGMVERNDLNIEIQFEQSSIIGYKIVRDGDYVVHLRSFQGGLAFSKCTGVCSPAYTILRPNNKLEYGYLSHYVTSNSFINSLKLVTYGIRDGRSINVNEWLDMKSCIPTMGKQKDILTIIETLGSKLINEKKIFLRLNKQKAYLLQQMFI